MAQMKITAENLVQRLNELVEEVKQFQQFPKDVLLQKPSPKKWNVLEIVDHLTMAYKVYWNRIDELIEQLPTSSESPAFYKPRPISKFFINTLRPKGTDIKWKMKTMSIFEPQEAPKGESADIAKVFADFYASQDHFKKSILKMRELDVSKGKLVSGIGPIVKFYLPECLEFHMGHQERHLLQIKNTLAEIGQMEAV